MNTVRMVCTVLAAMGVVGCADGNRYLANVPPKYTDVAELHHAECGNCHTRVEPGERTRAHFEAALARHHTRVKMDDTKWPVLIDYLSQTP
jgi:hypothetical protein